MAEPGPHDDLGTLLTAWRRATTTASKRAGRLRRKLQREHTAAAAGPRLQLQGEALKTQLHQVRPGHDQVVLDVPWLSDDPVIVPLRRDLSPRANLDRIFRRARGMRQALPEIERRLHDCEAQHAALQNAIEQIDVWREQEQPVDHDAVFVQIDQLRALGVRLPAPPTPQKAQISGKKARGATLPAGVRRFTTSSGAELCVGGDAKANDALVTRVARGRDIWLHVRDQRGAHVLLRQARMDSQPSNTDLREAAILCAHVSKVPKGDAVDVAWTRAKHVRKPKRAAAGLVLISGEKTLRVVVVPDVIAGFYQRRRVEIDAANEAAMTQSQARLR